MARLYPELTDTQLRELPSQAEATVYKCLRAALDDSYIIIHGKSYVARRKDGGHRDGEADFIIFSAKHGLLVVEVKGGGITYNPVTGWRSIDRMGLSHKMKDPLAQAKSQKYAILSQLQANQAWKSLRRRINVAHAVIFPDIESVTSMQLPEYPAAIIGGKAALKDMAAWVKSVYQFWGGVEDIPLGADGLEIVERVLCHPIDVRPLLRDILDLDNKLRIRLTNEQASVLRTLARHKRAAIVGPAGTGKTILAIEKVRMLAADGADILLLCYNRALGVMLSQQFKTYERVWAGTFHQFCQYSSRLCIERGIPDPLRRANMEFPNDDYYDVQMPLAAFYAIEELGDALRYDAIVIDEGQDFGEEYWLPIGMALRSIVDSWLYIFYDENQRLYSRVTNFPIPEHDTFLLTKNCRNAKPIHDLAYCYYEGEPAGDSGIEGVNPILIDSPTEQAQAKQIARIVIKLLQDEKVAPGSIAVIVSGQQKEYLYGLLKSEKLPSPVKWSREEHFRTNSVLMDTIKRFKGLERDIIILWLDQGAALNDTIMYVGTSRAKSVLYIVSDKKSLEALNIG